MNTYLIKGAVALAIGVSTVTHPWGFNLQDGRLNFQVGSNNASRFCDENGCTVTQTDSAGNTSTNYVPYDTDARGYKYYCAGGKKYYGGKYYKHYYNDDYSVLNIDGSTAIEHAEGPVNIYMGSNLQSTNMVYYPIVHNINNHGVANYGNRPTYHYGSTYVCNSDTELVAGNDQIVACNNVVIPLKARDRIQYKRNGKIRINGEKFDVKKLSGKQVDIPTQEMAVNAVDVPGYLAQVHVGNESRISCDSAIAPVFDVKDGKLTASLNTAYKYKDKSPCDVFVKLLGSTLQAMNDSAVKLDKQPLEKLDAFNASHISGSITSPNDDASLKISLYNNTTVTLSNEGKRGSVVLNAQDSSSASIKDISAKNLKVTGDSRSSTYVDGSVDMQRLALNGSATYTAQRLKTEIADIDISGNSWAKLWVTKKLKGDITGVAHVAWHGNADYNKLYKSRMATWRLFNGPFE